MLKTSSTAGEHDNNARKPNVAIIPHLFIDRTDKSHLDDLIAVLTPLTNKVLVLTGGTGSAEHTASGREIIPYHNRTKGVEIVPISARMRTSLPLKAFEQASAQLRILLLLSKLREEIDILVLFLGGIEYAEQFAFAKYLSMKRLGVVTGLGSAQRIQPLKESQDRWQVGELMRLRINAILERLSYRLSDKLLVYDASIIDQAKVGRYREKIVVGHRHFVDFDQYRFENTIDQRDAIITYVGRLHEEKGVLNLIEAIPHVLNERDDVHFVIIGDGHLDREIRDYLDKYALQNSVELAGWIPHNRLPKYYAKSKLLVLPSYTEGLPHVMLEAMACGTPVLATPVGAVPKVITSGETGFLMHDNSPTCVAENIVEALTFPSLKRIALNARNLVEREFQYESVLETWEHIVCDMKRS